MPNPTREQFIAGLRNVRFLKNHRQMLQAHYGAPHHTLTATQIGEPVGWDKDTVNLHYGKFGHNLAIAISPPVSDEDANEWRFMLKAPVIRQKDSDMKLVMCDELAQALDDLCWGWCGEEKEPS